MRLIVSRGGYWGSPMRRFPCSTLSARTSGKSLSRASKARDVSNTDTSESESIGREALVRVLLDTRATESTVVFNLISIVASLSQADELTAALFIGSLSQNFTPDQRIGSVPSTLASVYC